MRNQAPRRWQYQPLFDHREALSMPGNAGYREPPGLTEEQKRDYRAALSFLHGYREVSDTFDAYRRDVERLLLWLFFVAKKTLAECRRDEFLSFLQFCQKPPKSWVGESTQVRFIELEGRRQPNPQWRPFRGKKDYGLSPSAMQGLFSVCSTFFNHLIREQYLEHNPVASIRQRSAYLQKTGQRRVRRLSRRQWRIVLASAEEMARENPRVHERTFFIISLLYGLYLRISDLVGRPGFPVLMNSFKRHVDGAWVFVATGKGNKIREVAVPDDVLESLKRYRLSLGLGYTLPSMQDQTPLLRKLKGTGPLDSSRHIRSIVEEVFNRAVASLRKMGEEEEALALSQATVHWLRHTGISDDINVHGRPLTHVRDDAGHDDISTTSIYIDAELRERFRSARKRTLVVPEDNT